MAGPTNSDIIKEIKTIRSVVEDHEGRIRNWEQFKIAYDAADAAVAKYKQEHQSMPVNMATKQPSLLSEGINKDFVNVVLKFLGIISVVLGILSLVVQYILK